VGLIPAEANGIKFLAGFMNSEQDVDFCEVCQAVVRDGEEHSWQAHGSSEQSAIELRAWKQKVHETGAHH
jgi:hypothetical protein